MPSSSAHDLGREFMPEVYRAAAEEHLGALEDLYGRRYYVLALYVAGLAVEAIMRAHRTRLDPAFDSRHDLYELYRAARFADLVPVKRAQEAGAALSTVAVRWSNNHRYRSEAAVRSYLKRARLDRGIKGDFVKANVRQAINAATELVTLGIARWKTSPNT